MENLIILFVIVICVIGQIIGADPRYVEETKRMEREAIAEKRRK